MIYDKLNVIDIEATCTNDKNKLFLNEIIEIGICVIDCKFGKIYNSEGIFVKPKCSEITEFCTGLTGITKEDVEHAPSFLEVCETLKNTYKTNERVWASYGNYDKNQFLRQCLRENVQYPFSNQHINIKTLVALISGKRMGMDKALNYFEIPLEGKHHRGFDDAFNIAKIFHKILW